MCHICQSDKNESLRCPAESIAKSNIGAGYNTLARNITELSNLGCLPNDFDSLSRLDEGDGLEETFSQRRARWHLSCYGKFNSTKVERTRKRRASSICDEPGTRQKILHQASTLSSDARVRQCAYTLQDERLLAKLSAGDLVALEASYHAAFVASL